MIQDTRIKSTLTPASSHASLSPFRNNSVPYAMSTPPRTTSPKLYAHKSMPKSAPSRAKFQSLIYQSPQRIMEESDIRQASGYIVSEPETSLSGRERRRSLLPRPLSPSESTHRWRADHFLHDDLGTQDWGRYSSSVLEGDNSIDHSDEAHYEDLDCLSPPPLPFPPDDSSVSPYLIDVPCPMNAWLTEDDGTGIAGSAGIPPTDTSEGAMDEEEDVRDMSESAQDAPDSHAEAVAAEANGIQSPSHLATTAGIAHSRRPAAECVIREFGAHKQEVCGLKWAFDEKQLASGGNDNKLFVWNMAGTGADDTLRRTGQSSPEHAFTDHTAAVKAIAWSPHQVRSLK